MPKPNSMVAAAPSQNGDQASDTAKSGALGAYIFHGIGFSSRHVGGQAYGDCPFCGKGGKFGVNVADGRWQCKSCMEDGGSGNGGGNVWTFIRLLHARSLGTTTREDWSQLARDRGLLYAETPAAWGAVRSVLTREWLLPGYGVDGKIVNLYAYRRPRGGEKPILLATTGLAHGIFGLGAWDPKKRGVWVHEGWNGMAFQEVAARSKVGAAGRLEPTSSAETSVLADANVVAVPGANSFKESWRSLFAGRRVALAFDNDHPVTVEGSPKKRDGAGWAGMRRAAVVMTTGERGPSEVRYLSWGGGDATHEPKLPSGWDVRDALSAHRTLAERSTALGNLVDMLRPAPAEWTQSRGSGAVSGAEMACLPCASWKTLVEAWGDPKCMVWTEGLDRALSVMMASILSVEVSGCQLWVKMLSPPSTGKSVLCEALSVNKRHVVANSVSRGFHSGYQGREGEDKDYSLVSQLRDKTLVTKDGDTLLKSDGYETILSEGRDVYDRVSRTHYRQGAGRTYEGLNMTWILCGTASLRQMDSTELGERFLNCSIMDEVDGAIERDMNRMVMRRLVSSIADGVGGVNQHGDNAEALLAKQLTGGFIDHLKTTCAERLPRVKLGAAASERIIDLGTFAAYMRTRPSKTQDESVHREMSTRLVEQMGRLALCLAVVLGRESVDAEVMRRVRRVALDTAAGRTMRVASILRERARGTYLASVATLTGMGEDRTRDVLKFMADIKLAESYVPKNQKMPRWKLTDLVDDLWTKVVGERPAAVKK